MLKYIYLVSVFSWLFLLQACGQSNASAYSLMLKGLYKNSVLQIAPADLKKKLQTKESIVLLDTRTPSEYKVSHIKGARFIDYNNFNLESLNDIPKSASIIVYCSVGYRSEKIGEKLQNAGYTNVLNLYGGIFKWVNDGMPVYNREGETQQVHAYSKSWGVWLQKGEKIYE
jgi:rhodanese-related sulfurtransferase